MNCHNGMKVAVLAALATGLVACSKKEEAPVEKQEPAPAVEEVKPEPVDPVVARMQDPVYLKKLNKQYEDNKTALREFKKAQAAYAAAKEAGATEAELVPLQEAVETAARAFEAQERKSKALVRDQIRGQQSAQ